MKNDNEKLKNDLESKFPKDFLWGTATSSYQVEGNNSNTDWWEWEQRGKTKDKSGMACDYWNRYKEDHQLLQELGVNSFRLSLEWSRIEPEEGKFSEEAIQHYREILQDLKNRNIKTVVTFWHWTSPIWFEKKYGLHSNKSVKIFTRYGDEIIEKLGDLIDVAVILNEPMMPLVFGYLIGKFPPGKINPLAYKKAFNNLAKVYKNIYQHIKNERNDIPVGITTLYDFFEPDNKNSYFQKLIVKIAKKFWNDSFCKKISGSMDYFGLDYYMHFQLSFTGPKYYERTLTEMGWEIYPEGLYESLKEIYSEYRLPIYIMENGIADADDIYRSEFIAKHAESVRKALNDGVDVKGYFYWSLLDNYEWLLGFEKRFGLVEIDYKTLERKPRKSFYFYRDLIKKYSGN